MKGILGILAALVKSEHENKPNKIDMESPLRSNPIPPDNLDNISAVKTILNLKCQSCGGTYESTNQISYECPYCHSKQIIMDSDAVVIARDRHQTYKDIEISKQQIYKELEIEKERLKRGYTNSGPQSREDKILAITVLLIMFLSLLACLIFM